MVRIGVGVVGGVGGPNFNRDRDERTDGMTDGRTGGQTDRRIDR